MKNEDKKVITSAYNALEFLNNLRMVSYRDNLFADFCQSEKQHHKNSGLYNASVSDCARMFVVRWIAGYLTGEIKMPTVKEYLYIRHDCYMAAALVANYRKEIHQAWSKFNLSQLAAFDYCGVIK